MSRNDIQCGTALNFTWGKESYQNKIYIYKNHSVAIPIAATTFNLLSHLLPPPLQKSFKKKKKNPHPKLNFQN